ncbi:hypothetical protein B9G53_08605 [Pseudanabaena sp. SR411]|jgi:MinD superfamily P-loop ATPase|uniref:hypothetical protein n=1 Tax=Pseudanabaena sp. SR411 TaxID=1980935 RepID=UPI000B98F96D|nr:hypothetical protein [Pseudanabaena sp. SR411]OYQ65144.1 hypothetical protein B9G53_08605 [Pseudanabaena sp. SR411]
MPYKLENQEIYWEVCLSQCPKAAIQLGSSGHYLIDQHLCNRCLYAKFPKFLQQQESSHALHN